MMRRRNTKAIISYLLFVLALILLNSELFAAKYYSYQSGNWSGTSYVWTTDSTGSTLVGPALPVFANNDIICILTGRYITLNANVTTTGHVITIVVGAVLDLGLNTFTQTITLNGNGIMRTSRVSAGIATFPVVTGGSFLTIEGGTVEYYPTTGSFYIDDARATYCNLIINLSLVSQVMTVRRNLTIYGSFTVRRGTFQINDATTTKRTIIVNGNVTVDANGKITTGTGNTNTSNYKIQTTTNLPPGGQFHTFFHELTIGGDFKNNGSARFTNLTAPLYDEFASNGAVTVRFNGERHSTLTLNGVTDFYNLIVDKGIDQTYILTINSSAIGNFTLYGSNAVRRNEDPPYTQDNPEVRKALWIKNGTLKLTGSIWIPTLAEGPVGSTGNGDYAIGSTGQLWIAGSNVKVYVTATNADGYPQAPVGAIGVSTYPGTAEQALSIFGTFRISDGYFSTRHSAGIIFWNTDNSSSVVMVEGGTLNTTVMRSTWTAPGKTSYVQTGGTVIVRGDESEVGEMSGVPIFNIPNPSSTFVMTGGDIIIRDCNNGNVNGNGLYLNCDPGNFNVTGGNITFEINPLNTASVDIYSRVNFWNLNIKRLDTTGNAATNANINLLYDLVVTNKLTIYANATLSSGSGNNNIHSYGDFIINPGGTYSPGTNTTSFKGYGNYFLWNDGSIRTGTANGLYNLDINKTEGGLILVSSGTSFIVRNDLSITSGTLADGGKFVFVNGNVINNGIHVGAGKVSLNRSTGTQTISGNGLGLFQNLELNNATGSAGSVQVSLAADISVTGILALANDRLFNLDKYQLTLMTLATVEGTMSASRFILTSGAPSDGGLRRVYSDTTAFLFPVGSGTNYTPATIHIRKIPTTYGSVTVKPVPFKHPFTTNATCLATYWKIEEYGFTDIRAASVRMVFNYGTLADNIAYVPGKYIPAAWTYTNDVTLVNESTNLITFTGENEFTGDYTAGIPAAFGLVTSFYSRASGNWNTPSTWSNAGFGGVAASTVPGPSNPVFIGNGLLYNHTIVVTAGNATSGSLSVIHGSVLDLGATTGNNFGTVIPGSNGKIRITSTTATALFPAGDFGNFLGQAGGTVEYYTGSLNYIIPTTSNAPTSRAISTYYHLALSPSTGFNITMPNRNLTVYGNMVVSGASGTGLARLNAVSATTLTIRDSLNVNSGTLLFQNNFAQALRIDGNINIASGAVFNVANTGTAVNNTLSIGGNISNDGILDLSISATLKCNVTFTGNTDVVVKGRGATTDFNLITVDKGTSSIPVVNVISSAFSFSNNNAPLILVNGTFRLTTALTVAVSTLGFDIPPTTCLSASGGTILVATSASDDADVVLSGMLEVKAGAIMVGTSTNNVNNDIEYSGAGFPAIEARGGNLFVNGQIRRSMINGLGSLVYKQSGTSTVTVNGRNGQPTRAKLEVVNSGSIFNMTGGTLTIVRGGSITYNDLYIRPESSIVTGGTIIFGNTDTEATSVSNLTLDSTFPLNNITVDGTTNAKTLTLAVNPLILKGSLVINANSSFRADSLNVSIAGNLTNLNTDAGTGINTGGYRPGSFRQLTTLNGSLGNQTVTGASGNVTNFAMLVVNNTFSGGTITLQSNTALRINGDLTLTNGNLADGGNVITVIGDISNSSTHSSSGSGRILLAGPAVQFLSGNGSGKFGNLYLNALYDVRMISIMEITGVLTFRGTNSINTGKLLDIGNKLLILSSTAAASIAVISPAVFSATCCIRSDGLISDAGVLKYYPSSTRDFTFPIGVPGKYTPVRMNVTANNAAGTITIIPVNSQHPCNTGTGTNILTFYWHVIKSGFNGLTISQYYTYAQADVKGTENTYVGNRYNYLTGIWDNPASGTAINTSTNVITFGNKNFIDGDYTAGQSSEFGIVPTYYSRNVTCNDPLVGNWDANATWSTDAVLKHAGAAAASYPTGEPVVIATNHIVSTNGISRKTSILTLNGTGIIDLASTVGHDFGTVLGTGTIRLTPSAAGFYVFPAGNFTIFTAVGGGTVELSNTSGTAVFPYLTTYNNLILKGAGAKQMIDADITLNGNLTNEASSSFIASGIGSLILNADWINHGSFTHNSGNTVFNGVSTLSGNNPPILNNIVINSGKSMIGPFSAAFGVAGNWLDNGVFNHNSGTVNFSGNSTITGQSITTFNNLTIENGQTLTGKLNDGIVVIGNWVNRGVFNHNGGNVIFDGSSLVSGTSVTNFGNLTINDMKFLTGPLSNKMIIARDFINNGIFINNGGTLEFNGAVQELGGVASALFENITIDAGSTTSINSPGQTLRGVLLSNGILNANDNITLLSDASRTALIDGSGEGEVLGNLTIQRYLPFGFGYKYFSSPFQAAEVGQFGDHMDLGAWFPTFYRYDENRIYTGWLKYVDPGGILAPMQGYAVNFGSVSEPMTVDISGQVNNNNMLPVTAFNSNHPYTLGFNLIGNPYPSPIDWDSPVGWVRENIDEALYFFNAGNTDQYTGTYSTYINGISSDGVAGPIIPAMQGFFMHVSNLPPYPVAATLIFTNHVRVNNLAPNFHKDAKAEIRPMARITARFGVEGSNGDPLVIYFDEEATLHFDPEQDALKLMNTDIIEPNLYSVSDDAQKLSISGQPLPVDSITIVPLCLKTGQQGMVIFNCGDIKNMPLDLFIYFCDKKTGVRQNVMLHPEYKTMLEEGDFEDRFSLIFSKSDLRYQPSQETRFYVYAFRNRLYIYMNLPAGEKAELKVHNMLGQQVCHQVLQGNGYREMDLEVKTGIDIVTISSPGEVYTKKVYINNQW
ncbi:MAG: hypothetical protein ACOYNC_11870 [Bacteroidales bacterium]